MQTSIYKLQPGNSNLQYANFNKQTLICRLPYANCNILLQYANCNMQTAICKLQYANCNMQTVIYYCNMQTAICKLQYANCHMQTAICKLKYANCHIHFHIQYVIGFLILESTQNLYWVPDSVSDSIPHSVSDSKLN